VQIFFAFIFSQTISSAVGVVSVLTTLLGIWFEWRRPRDREDVEDAIKDRKITEAAAQRRIKFIDYRPWCLICLGVALLVLAMVGMSDGR